MLPGHFPYSRRPFVTNLVSIVIVMAATISILVLASTDIAYIAIILALEALVLIFLGISPLLTEHEILGGYLILRQGWYFRAAIPLEDIRKVERVSRGPRRVGVFFRLLTSTLYVTSRRSDLIELELKRKQKFGWALGKRADRVVFDAEDVPRTVEAIRAGSLSPVEPYGPHAKLRY
jgi:hypothetical protein